MLYEVITGNSVFKIRFLPRLGGKLFQFFEAGLDQCGQLFLPAKLSGLLIGKDI